MTILDLILGSLATYRLALMVSREDGLFWMFKHLRRVVKREAPKKTHMDEGIECTHCVSMQFAIVLAFLGHFLRGNQIFYTVVVALAMSGGAIILHHAFTEDFKK